jgi:phosphoribosylformylglycinamidine synthase
MASEEFTEGSEQKRPNVQMGDPFLEKLLLEACLEAMATGAVLGIQDMGAAGLTCSTCEMGARGELGLTIELDLVPQRETGMSSYEIMLSESQERMLLVAEKGREGEVLRVFEKWGLDASIVGIVTADDTMRVTHHGELVAEIPNKALTDDAPVYHRPVGTWKAPVPLDPPAWVLEELKKPRDYTADLKKLLASANICSKHWIFEQYDSMVQTNTVQGPGGEAGVMRIKGTGSAHHGVVETLASIVAASTPEGEAALQAVELAPKPERGLAMALAGNGRWTYLDPKLGAMHAVAEAARKVACTGATPVAATNCLNFGNPEKPEIMAQLSAAIDGIAEACNALGTPITGGNVSLYNETKGEGIYPTPVLGVVGILNDVTKAVPSAFQNVGDAILLIFWEEGAIAGSSKESIQELGSSEFAKTVLGSLWGEPPYLNLDEEGALQNCLSVIASKATVNSACDISDGGIAVALAKAACQSGIGFRVEWGSKDTDKAPVSLFGEHSSIAVVTCPKEAVDEVVAAVADAKTAMIAAVIGETVSEHVEIKSHGSLFSKGTALIDTTVAELRASYTDALESQLAAEVLA